MSGCLFDVPQSIASVERSQVARSHTGSIACSSLFSAGRTRSCFLCRRWRAHRIESTTCEISRVTAEISTTKKHRQSVNRDQPNRKRLGANAWFAFFALNSGVHLLHIRLLAIIHPLPHTRWRFRFVVHCIVILPALVRLLQAMLPVRLLAT